MLGVAALVALYQTHTILEEILKVQRTSTDIQIGVNELKSAVNQLETIAISNKSESIIKKVSAIPETALSEEKIKEIIPLESNLLKAGQVYLPKNKFSETTQVLSNQNLNNDQKMTFLRENLAVKRLNQNRSFE